MATDPVELKKQLEDLKNEFELINKSMSSFASQIGGTLAGVVTEAEDLVDAFSRGANVTKKIEAQLLKNKKALEANILDEAKAIAQGNKTKAATLVLQRQILYQLDTQLKTLQRVNEDYQKNNTILGFIKEKWKDISKSFREFFSIASIFKMIVDGALRFSKISTDIGKNLGYGADNANRVAKNMISTAQSARNVNVTFQNLADAANELSTATGFVAEYSADALETQIMLTKQFGLTGEEAAGVYRLSVLTGKSSKEVNDAMVGAFVATRNQLKVGIPFKATIAEAAKVSGRLAANLQNNPEQIVKAVAQAKALGTSLEQTAKQGESLLNFETSIENELKAELLTGKQLNLERARAAALVGDQVALAEELNSQVGSLEEFQQMNVLQQKAIAEAVGLTSDELADQLRKQKLAQEQGKSLAQITKEEALAAEQRQATQDKFNQALLKVQDLFGNLLAGPLGQFLEFLTKSLDYITAIGAGLLTWKITSKAVAFYQNIVALSKQKEIGFGQALLMQSRTQLGLDTASATAKVAGSAAATFGAILPIVLGAVATVGTLLASYKADDLMSESGYGKRTLLAPEGAFKLNDNDTVIAGTNLGGGGGGSMPQVDLTPMIAAINEVRNAVNNLANKPSVINMDGKQVGSNLVQNTYKLA
jgi:hypothetical protein